MVHTPYEAGGYDHSWRRPPTRNTIKLEIELLEKALRDIALNHEDFDEGNRHLLVAREALAKVDKLRLSRKKDSL